MLSVVNHLTKTQSKSSNGEQQIKDKEDMLTFPNSQLKAFRKRLTTWRSFYSTAKPTKSHTYRLEFYASSSSKIAYETLDCKMGIQLFGDTNMTREIPFSSPDPPSSSKPSTVDVDGSFVGEIFGIALGYRTPLGGSSKRDVHVGLLVITDEENDSQWQIPIYNWFSLNYADRSLYRIVWAYPRGSNSSLAIPVKFKFDEEVLEMHPLGMKPFMLFKITFQSGPQKWRIHRRIADFRRVSKLLKDRFPDSTAEPIHKLSEAIGEADNNRLILKKWLRDALSDQNILNQNEFRAFVHLPPDSLRSDRNFADRAELGNEEQKSERTESSNFTTMDSTKIVRPKRSSFTIVKSATKGLFGSNG